MMSRCGGRSWARGCREGEGARRGPTARTGPARVGDEEAVGAEQWKGIVEEECGALGLDARPHIVLARDDLVVADEWD